MTIIATIASRFVERFLKSFFFSICFCSRRHIGLSSINKNEGVTHKEDVVVIIYVYMEKLGKKFQGIGNECKMEQANGKIRVEIFEKSL